SGSHYQRNRLIEEDYQEVLDEYRKNFSDSWKAVQADCSQAWPYLDEALTKFQSGCWKEGVDLFHYMLEMDAKFDEVTLISVLTACGRAGALELGEWIKEYIEANRLKGNATLVTALIDICEDVIHESDNILITFIDDREINKERNGRLSIA
ncbi:hypothetical protein Ccrd_025935, partial [Cynara cardunculus var. scolymus]